MANVTTTTANGIEYTTTQGITFSSGSNPDLTHKVTTTYGAETSVTSGATKGDVDYQVTAGDEMGQGWGDLYKTYDKWRQEDKMWYDQAIGAGDEVYPRKMAEMRAQMAAGGMKKGSYLWNSNMNKLVGERNNIDVQYANKQALINNSSMYNSLVDKYSDMKNLQEKEGGSYDYTTVETKPQSSSDTYTMMVREGYTKPGYMRTLYTTDFYGNKSASGSTWVSSRKIDPIYQQRTTTWSESPTTTTHYTGYEERNTGNLLYGEGGDRSRTPTFDEFWGGQVGGATDVSNPYEPDAPIGESQDVTQAKLASSGRAY